MHGTLHGGVVIHRDAVVINISVITCIGKISSVRHFTFICPHFVI